MPLGLVLGAPLQRGTRPGPAQPSLLANTPYAKPIVFDRLELLARKLQGLRTAGGIERSLELRADVATYDGSDAFPVFTVWMAEAEEEPAGHVATIAVQGATLWRMMLALAEAAPNVRDDREAA